VPAVETVISADNSVETEALAQDLPRYEEEQRRLTQRGAVIGCVLATGIAPLYIATDYWLYPQYFWPLFVARMLSILLGMGVLLLLRRPAGMRLTYVLVAVLCMGLALFNSAVPVCLLGYDVPYYVASILVICGVALLLPWGASQAAALVLSLLAMYVVASALHGAVDDWLAFACDVSFVVAAVGIALGGLQASEKLRKHEFCARAALQRAYGNKSELAAALADKTAKVEMLHREMEDLLYAASHDLRVPLINVQGFSRELRLGLDHLRNSNGSWKSWRSRFAVSCRTRISRLRLSHCSSSLAIRRVWGSCSATSSTTRSSIWAIAGNGASAWACGASTLSAASLSRTPAPASPDRARKKSFDCSGGLGTVTVAARGSV